MHDGAMDLAERVLSALIRSPFVDSRWLRPEVRDGVVVLRGSLPTYYQKQMAQEQIRDLAGVAEIANEIQVQGERHPMSVPYEPGRGDPFVNEWSIEPATAPAEPTGAERLDTAAA